MLRKYYDILQSTGSGQQHSFIKNRSHLRNLSNVLGEKYGSVENGNVVKAFYPDFNKAFDRQLFSA